MTKNILVILFILSIGLGWHTAAGEVTIFDTGPFRYMFRLVKLVLYGVFGRTGVEKEYYLENLKDNRLQHQFSITDRFFCNPNGPGARSLFVPQSVHTLRPGDIDIIGAIGDSYTAGNGGMGTGLRHLLIENRGVVSQSGGQATWRQFFTIPNLLKVYNPNLIGYSVTDALGFQRESGFNTAEMGAMSRDMPFQAWNIIKRMRSNPHVNIKKHWKMIFYWIGTNDFCVDMCYLKDPAVIVMNHVQNLLSTLRILRDNLPRTMVNVMASPNLDRILEIRGKPNRCIAFHPAVCPCFFSLKRSQYINYYRAIIEAWREAEREVVNRVEFHTKEDFTVNYLPATEDLSLPKNHLGLSDLTYMAVDCFHIGQKGYARMTNAIWNNLMEPYSNRTKHWSKEFVNVKCPTETQPFITTKWNNS